MQAARTILTKRDPAISLSDDAKEHALRQFLSRAVVSTYVMDYFGCGGTLSVPRGMMRNLFPFEEGIHDRQQ